jgi:hypothetical protein
MATNPNSSKTLTLKPLKSMQTNKYLQNPKPWTVNVGSRQRQQKNKQL